MTAKSTITARELSRRTAEALKDIPACASVTVGPIIQRDEAGQWTVNLTGRPSGSCMREFMSLREALQAEFDLVPFQPKG